MNKNELDELQNPENWAMEHAVRHEPSKPSRAVVSVRFSGDDLATIARAARENGMKTSEFIRNAALAEASRKRRRAFDAFAGGASEGVSTILTTNWRRGGRARLILRAPLRES